MATITILDRQTGVEKDVFTEDHDPNEDGTPYFSWKEGNYSCDCNRGIEMYGYVEEGPSFCKGCVRFIVTKLNGQPVDFKEWNEDYDVNTTLR